MTQANTDITTLQSRIDALLSTEKRLLYTFLYSNGYISKPFSWEISITLKDYLYYRDMTHTADPMYSAMVLDSYADAILKQVAQKIKDIRSQDTINLAPTFVQTLAFTNKDILTPPASVAQYPVETLYVPAGDY
ncbi:MAG TPA: hypothetical protein VEH58_04815 [Dehalococcoidales bacterium]|nr:hypothetical protein [Dehalococcoidales bacterium]